jgi:hypothetical protein
VSVVEGNSGTTPVPFVVQLFPASGQTVSVNCVTSSGSADSSDFSSVSRTLTFAPGETNQVVTVLAKGDLLNEPDEFFALGLSSPSNAVLARSQAEGLIVNDDPLPVLMIYNAMLAEGDHGESNVLLTVSLSAPSGRTVSVGYETPQYNGGTAELQTDYVPTNGILVFPPGLTSQAVSVRVKGDNSIENTETFFVDLDSPQNATLANYRGTGFIVNDDGLPGQLHHFTWAAIPTPQPATQPIPVTLLARDYFDNTVGDFAGPVSLSAFAVAGESSRTILNAPIHSSSFYTSYTEGFAFTPNTDLRGDACAPLRGHQSVPLDGQRHSADQPSGSGPFADLE